jgi:hypothetical protein
MGRAMANCSRFESKGSRSGKLMLTILGSGLLRKVGSKLSIKQRNIKESSLVNNAVTTSKHKLKSINRYVVV